MPHTSIVSSPGLGTGKMDVQQVAQTLRQRLAYATIQASRPCNVTIQTLAEVSSSPLSSGVTSPPSTSSASPLAEAELNFGLGIGLTHEQQDVRDLTCAVQKSRESTTPASATASQHALANSPREPSLYDTIFGPAYSRLTKRPPCTSTNGDIQPSPPMARSPHVREGSSAQLEKIASSPRISFTSPTMRREFASPQRTGAAHSGHRRNRSLLVQSFASPPYKHKRELQDEDAFLTRSPARERMRSAGGSLLPNGHPASSLAQDLGIASGSTPRSRRTSSNFLTERRHDDVHDPAEIDRLAGLLSSMAEGRRRSVNSPISSSTSTFADPNIVTPRRRRRRMSGGGEAADGNEAAAHSLLDLAASPSPSPLIGRQQQEWLPGATPSLQRMFDRRASGSGAAKPRRLIDQIGDHADSPGFMASRQADFPQLPMSISPAERTPEKATQHLRSPPLTPPRSTKRSDEKTSIRSFADSEGDESSPCPTTPTPTPGRKGQVVLLSEEIKEGHDGCSDSMVIKQEDGSIGALGGVIETPRTPPPLSAPSTPKAPGSNFSYGDFLHVSPSPQPRMRMSSANGGKTPRIGSAYDTPTRGTRSRARFIDYGGLDLGEDAPLTEDFLPGDVLTPGKHILQSSPRIGLKRPKVPND